tara:strand:+ start:1574 stop:2557 length:984 start_codon:yes stop_codon:yes gene_type:complete
MELIKEKMSQQINVRTGRVRAVTTVDLYIKLLKSLHLRIFNEQMTDVYWLVDTEKVLGGLKEMNKSTMNNYLSAIIGGIETLGNQQDAQIETYRKKIAENNSILASSAEEQKKTITEGDNWCKLKELQAVASSYKRDLVRRKTFHKTADTISGQERELLKKWLVTSLYTTDPVNNPPLRGDYANMKIISVGDFNKLEANAKNTNYLVIKSAHKKFFSLGKYKTVGTYGIKHIEVGKKLNGVLNKFLKLHNQEYLFYNCSGKTVLQAGAFGKFVSRAFEPCGKNITINLIRHIVLTEWDTGPSIKERKEKANLMAHSPAVASLYVKKD